MSKTLIPKDLCTRCGACFAADSNGILKKDSRGFPVYEANESSEIKDLLEVCSGENWNYLELLNEEYGSSAKYDPSSPDIGIHRSIFLVSSSSDRLRKAGQSGGVTTTLLRFAMECGIIDAVLAVRRPQGAENNPYSAEPFIARDAEELMDSCGSKYTICSVLEKVSEISGISDKFAITALPCQTVGLKRLQREFGSDFREKCKLVIGPYCGLNMEVEAGHALAKAAGLNPGQVTSFQNRGGLFPGQTTLLTKEGQKNIIDRTAHRILYRMFSPIRCYTCTDYGNELADLAIADCWVTENGGFKYPEGAAYVVCRSKRGEELVEEAIYNKQLISHSFDSDKAKKNWEPSFYHRKVRAHNRIEYWKKRGRLVPSTDYEMPNLFRPSLLADNIEMGAWRLFRWGWIRNFVLRFWLWLAQSPEKSARRLIFEDCKFYLFTHTYNQFNKMNYRKSLSRYKNFLKVKARKRLPEAVYSIGKIIYKSLKRLAVGASFASKKDAKHLLTSPNQASTFRDWGFYNEKWEGSPRILMAAGHGYGNVGDEAQCGACISRWKKVAPDCKITLFSPNPAYTEALHGEQCEWAPRVAWFEANTKPYYFKAGKKFRWKFWWARMRLTLSAHLLKRSVPVLFCSPEEASTLQVIKDHDLLHISGGGFLTGKTRSRLWENCLLMEICQILDIPYMLTGHNIGVFQDSADRRVTRRGLRKAKYIGLRDRGLSERELEKIGISGDHVVSGCDDALICSRLDSPHIRRCLLEAGADPEKPCVAVHFHDWGQSKAERDTIAYRYANVCDYLAGKHKLQVVFIAMVHIDIAPEENVIRRMSQPAFLIPYSPDYRVVRGIIADAKFCFTMKHHPIVFSQGEGTPVLSISLDDYYYHKNKGALGNTGHGKYALDRADFESDIVFDRIEELLAGSAKIRQEMKQWVCQMQHLEMVIYKKAIKDL